MADPTNPTNATGAAGATSAAANTGAAKSVDYIKKLADFLDAYPGAPLREVIRLIPDGLFVGTGLFALMSQNYPIAMLFLTLFETLLITVGLQNLFGYISLPDVLPNAAAVGRQCVSGFQSPTLQTMSIFFQLPVKSAFPSPPVFVFATACVYVLSCMQSFINEMEELGPGFSTRYYLGIFLTIITLSIVTLFRFLTRCDSWGVLATSLLAGLMLGLALCWQNKTLFGKEAINLLGVPYFTNTTADGKPLYICPQNLVPRT